MSKRSTRLVRIVTIALVLVVVVFLGWIVIQPTPDLVQGEFEMTEVRVAGKVPARIEVIHVREGDTVQRGELLVSLSSPEIEAKLDQAEAVHAAAIAQREKADSGAREEEIQGAMNQWLRAKHAADLAATTAGRIERLFRDGVVPEQRHDEAVASRDAAREAASAARAVYDMALAGARDEDRRSAAAMETQAAGAISEVRAWLGETRLLAPLDGEVSVIVAEAGELAASGYPVLMLLDLKDPWATFNLREDRLGALRMGSRFRVQVPALGDRQVELEVSHIAAQGEYATWRATSAAGGFDLKTFEVRARPVEPVEGLRPGMSAIVNWDELNDD